MISKIFVIASGGKLCYSKSFLSQSKIDIDLVSGFLSAFSNFAEEITAGKIKNLNFYNFNFVYEYDIDLDCMFVLVIDIDDIEEEARSKVELLKNEFLKRYRKDIEGWTGNVNIFKEFHEFAENHIFIPPKILIVGEDGVGKSTIMNLFPGELVLELDEDLNEIIEKPINVSGLKSIKQFILREMNLEDLIDNSKQYRPLLNSVDVILIVTNSTSSNLGRTKKLFSRLKALVTKPAFFTIANFQDLTVTAFEPEKIAEAFGIKTFPFSAIQPDARNKIYSIMVEILKASILDKYMKSLKGLLRK